MIERFFDIALSITLNHASGILPPEGAIPNIRTSAPFKIAASRLSTIGTLLLIELNSFVFLPLFSESITATIVLDKYLKTPIPIFP